MYIYIFFLFLDNIYILFSLCTDVVAREYVLNSPRECSIVISQVLPTEYEDTYKE